MPVSFLAYSSTLKTEATCSSETSVDFHRTTQRYIPEHVTLHNHRCEYLKSYLLIFAFSDIRNSNFAKAYCTLYTSETLIVSEIMFLQKKLHGLLRVSYRKTVSLKTVRCDHLLKPVSALEFRLLKCRKNACFYSKASRVLVCID
jgi:hypothetical protein